MRGFGVLRGTLSVFAGTNQMRLGAEGLTTFPPKPAYPAAGLEPASRDAECACSPPSVEITDA
jgi:hypothetical protein